MANHACPRSGGTSTIHSGSMNWDSEKRATDSRDHLPGAELELAYTIRVWGGYPDGIAFAVLLMNAAAPAIDYFTRPRTFGHGSGA